MSRLLSWVVPALLIAGGWFAWKEGKPLVRNWRVENTAKQVCKDIGDRVIKGLNQTAAREALDTELRARMRQRADVILHTTDYQFELWQGKCKVRVTLPDGTEIRAVAPFPTDM